MLPLIRKHAPSSTIIGFKLAETKEQAIKKAKQLQSKIPLNSVIANTIESLGSSTQSIWIVDQTKKITSYNGSKEEVTRQLLTYLSTVMS
jgi:hypothetical protein